MRKRIKQEIIQVNEFHCCGCAFSHADFIEHLRAAHGFIKGTQCSRSLVQALDGSDFYSNTYALEIPCAEKTIKATQIISGPRAKGDLMAMDDDE